MQINEIWPFLLPGIIIQLFMQITYIVKGLKNIKQKSQNNILYISSIVIFGLAAIAFYLLRAKKTDPKDTSTSEIEKSIQLTKEGIFFLLVIAYQVMGLHMLAENTESYTYMTLVWLLSVSFVVMLLYNLLPKTKFHLITKLFPILQLILCIPIQYLDLSGDNLFISIIAGFSAINYASLSYAKVYGIGALGSYLIGSTVRTIVLASDIEISNLVRYFFVNTLVVILALLAFYTLKTQIITSIKLEKALQILNKQSEQLKGMTIVEERNRMAAEMHDTVGHTLTAAYLMLEEAEGLSSKKNAIQKLRQGKDLVQRGLYELRMSVKEVRAANEIDFITTTKQLLNEILVDTGLKINLVLESEINLTSIQAGILLGAIKECATNAIKHGNATQADILIAEHKNQLQLSFTDNGSGSSNFQLGSGLSIMRDRLESVGGKLEIETTAKEGFTVSLIMPIVLRKEQLK